MRIFDDRKSVFPAKFIGNHAEFAPRPVGNFALIMLGFKGLTRVEIYVVYIDYIFPSFNIRFIALSDNVDTPDRNSSAMDLMPVMNFVSAQYGQNPEATDLPIFDKRALPLRNVIFLFR